MPPRLKFTKDEIINKALDVVRREGMDALSARTLSSEIGASTKIIFSSFSGMDELKKEVALAAYALYNNYISREISKGEFPEYKASGMAYIRFAREEKELFRYLFMRDRSKEIEDDVSKGEIDAYARILAKNFNISEEVAFKFHVEMWICVHGIASMMATDYLDWDWSYASEILSDMYNGIKSRLLGV